MNQIPSTPEEADALQRLFVAWQDLKKLGWDEAMYAPRDSSVRLQLIEIGSTGIHQGWRDSDGSFWVYDGETYPASPCLFRTEAKARELRVADDNTHNPERTTDAK